MPSPARDVLKRLAKAEDEIRRLKLKAWGEGSGGGFDPKGVKLKNTGSMGASGGHDNWLEFNSIIYDSSGGAIWTPAHATRLYAPVAGLYSLTASWSWSVSTFADGAQMTATVRVTHPDASEDFTGGDWDSSNYMGYGPLNVGIACHVPLGAGDYVEVSAIPFSAGRTITNIKAGFALAA